MSMHFSVVKEAGSATVGYLRIAINGDAEELDAFETQSIRALANTSDAGAGGIIRTLILSKGDYIELWITTANANNLTVATMSIVIQEK